MSTKKTIQINPELFKVAGNKTRKNKEKKELTLNPIVNPSSLKNKLLKRIKEHKGQEVKTATKPAISNYSDEFYGALDYLSDLTKKQKVTQAKQRSLNTKTLKTPPSISNYSNISLDLPPELQEPKTFIPQTNEVFNVNYRVEDEVPYGCLKGGKKKTYREWKELTKPDIPDIIRPPTPPKRNENTIASGFLSGAIPIDNKEKDKEVKTSLSREERLEQIKQKLRQMQDKETLEKQDALDNFRTLEKSMAAPILEDINDIDSNETPDIEALLQDRHEKQESEKTKKYMKKTIKRKFTLGKSDKLRRVAVLIKNRQTRKNILNTQKELKKTNITDIRKYLRQHGMIKVGSTCPADILRKTFEAAILTGEVNNTNKDVLLHNFMAGMDDEK